MFKHLLSLLLLIFAASTLTACATGNDGPRDPLEDEIAERGPPQCVRQDIGPMNSTIVSCVQDYGPSAALPEGVEMRNPHVVTVIETPRGSFGNPLTWSMEVRRDGELLVEREFGEDDTVVEDEEGRSEIRLAVPLNEEDEQLVPGIYEFRYLQDEEGEVGTTTIEIEPPEDGEEDEEAEEGEQEEQAPEEQAD